MSACTTLTSWAVLCFATMLAGDLAFNIALGATLVALPLSIGAAARSAFVKYKFTDKRVSVKTDAPWESEFLSVDGLCQSCGSGKYWRRNQVAMPPVQSVITIRPSCAALEPSWGPGSSPSCHIASCNNGRWCSVSDAAALGSAAVV